MWELGELKISVFLKSAILIFFSKFWWLPWFPAPNNTCLLICNTVYVVRFVKKWTILLNQRKLTLHVEQSNDSPRLVHLWQNYHFVCSQLSNMFCTYILETLKGQEIMLNDMFSNSVLYACFFVLFYWLESLHIKTKMFHFLEIGPNFCRLTINQRSDNAIR